MGGYLGFVHLQQQSKVGGVVAVTRGPSGLLGNHLTAFGAPPPTSLRTGRRAVVRQGAVGRWDAGTLGRVCLHEVKVPEGADGIIRSICRILPGLKVQSSS